MRTGPGFLAAFLLLAGLHAQDGAGPRAPTGGPLSLSEDQTRDLFRQAADADLKNDKKQRDYTYTEREVMRTLDGKGRVKSTESKTYEVMEIYGSEVHRLVAKDDKALSGDAVRKEEERIQKVVARRTNEDQKERAKREERSEKRREEDRQFVREVADAYNFRLTGAESLDGRETYVIDAEPRPGYQPRLKEARILSKCRFRAWIDKSEAEWKMCIRDRLMATGRSRPFIPRRISTRSSCRWRRNISALRKGCPRSICAPRRGPWCR